MLGIKWNYNPGRKVRRVKDLSGSWRCMTRLMCNATWQRSHLTVTLSRHSWGGGAWDHRLIRKLGSPSVSPPLSLSKGHISIIHRSLSSDPGDSGTEQYYLKEDPGLPKWADPLTPPPPHPTSTFFTHETFRFSKTLYTSKRGSILFPAKLIDPTAPHLVMTGPPRGFSPLTPPEPLTPAHPPHGALLKETHNILEWH